MYTDRQIHTHIKSMFHTNKNKKININKQNNIKKAIKKKYTTTTKLKKFIKTHNTHNHTKLQQLITYKCKNINLYHMIR